MNAGVNRLEMGNGNRAGQFVRQPGGYTCFIPAPLRPGLLLLTPGLLRVADEARGALGRLDGVAITLPDPDLFVAMYSRKESLLSSQIEGTRTSLIEVLEFEALRRGEAGERRARVDVREVLNHQRTLHYGLARLAHLPISVRLLNEMHAQLMEGVRGAERRVGELRRIQNWIGPPGAALETAEFVPPPPNTVADHMGALERYIHGDDETPILLKCALVHYQFETIHPYEDGNGRLGRLLVTLMLAEQRVLTRPLLYLSVYLRRNRQEYYDRLTRVRTADEFEGWVQFFLRGIREVAAEATETARQVLRMRDEHIDIARRLPSAHAPQMVDYLLRNPATTITRAAETLGIAYPTASRIISGLEEKGLLRELTGRARNRVYLYHPYIERLGGAFPPPPEEEE